MTEEIGEALAAGMLTDTAGFRNNNVDKSTFLMAAELLDLGIDVHKTAGWIDAGFKGNITLEIKNDSDKPFILQYMMPIGQVIFFTLTSPVERPYGHNELNNHYQDSKGTIYSRHMGDDNL